MTSSDRERGGIFAPHPVVALEAVQYAHPIAASSAIPLRGTADQILGIATNLDFEEWHNFLGNKGLVTALLSRLRHQRHTVKIDGPSLREPQS